MDENLEDSLSLLSELKKIPAIKFGLKLLNTFFYANDNLIYECFEKQIFRTKDNYVNPKSLSKQYNHEKYSKTIIGIIKKTKELIAPN